MDDHIALLRAAVFILTLALIWAPLSNRKLRATFAAVLHVITGLLNMTGF